MRVLTVVVVASVLLVFVGDGHTAPDRSVALWQGFDLAALGVTLLVVLASVVAGLVLRIPAGPMISAIVIGTAWNRSEERRVGKECVSTCRSRWSPYH